jgi:hypothetical protein
MLFNPSKTDNFRERHRQRDKYDKRGDEKVGRGEGDVLFLRVREEKASFFFF